MVWVVILPFSLTAVSATISALIPLSKKDNKMWTCVPKNKEFIKAGYKPHDNHRFRVTAFICGWTQCIVLHIKYQIKKVKNESSTKATKRKKEK
jgi:hypothetical protein